jgi:phage repressor protein C with HTH and peptisase S24 domain
VSPEGRPRWPSLESLSKILETTGVTPLDFFGYSGPMEIGNKRAPLRRLPTMGIRQMGEREPFDAQGHPKGRAWDDLPFPELPDRNAYGLVMAGDSAEPVYRDGDLLVVAPRGALRRGDPKAIRSITGRMRVCEFLRRTPQRYEIRNFAAAETQTIDAREIAFAHRIVWASQ